MSGGEEGVQGQEHRGSGESKSGMEYQAMVRKPGQISPLGRSFSAVRATADNGAELARDPKSNIFTG